MRAPARRASWTRRSAPPGLFAEGGVYNFGELDVGESGLTVRIVGAEGRIPHETTLRPES